MAKYLLLKHYRGAPAAVNDVPMDRWTPEEISAHIQYMRDFADRLEKTGEFVDGQALAPEGTFVRYDGEGRPPVTDGPFAEETDWAQIVEWYDELARLTDSPVVRLNRAVAVGEADGPRAGLAALAGVDDSLPRHTAVAAYLHERDGDLETAARLYAEAARKAPHLAERDHLTRQAARLNAPGRH